MDDDHTARLARAWDAAADGYETYFVPRFAPWVATAVEGLPEPPDGAIVVPCCGTFPELPALAVRYPQRRIVGVDLSPRMVELASRRAAEHPGASAVQGDAADLAAAGLDRAAALVSVFGLQQLPDPADAIANWLAALRPGGSLSVLYWPPTPEEGGPFALARAVVADALGITPNAQWSAQLVEAVPRAGGRLVRDKGVSHPMRHADARTFWAAMTTSGPMRALADEHGASFMDELGEDFLRRAPAGPWSHQPSARWLVATREH